MLQLRFDLSNLHFKMLIDTNTCCDCNIASVTKTMFFVFFLKLPRYYRVYFSLSAHLKKSSSSVTEGNCNKTRLLKLWVATPNGVAKQIGILCFVPRNFENPSSVAELLEKIMVIARVIGKSENLELGSECGPFVFREHLKLATKIDKSHFNSD